MLPWIHVYNRHISGSDFPPFQLQVDGHLHSPPPPHEITFHHFTVPSSGGNMVPVINGPLVESRNNATAPHQPISSEGRTDQICQSKSCVLARHRVVDHQNTQVSDTYRAILLSLGAELEVCVGARFVVCVGGEFKIFQDIQQYKVQGNNTQTTLRVGGLQPVSYMGVNKNPSPLILGLDSICPLYVYLSICHHPPSHVRPCQFVAKHVKSFMSYSCSIFSEVGLVLLGCDINTDCGINTCFFRHRGGYLHIYIY